MQGGWWQNFVYKTVAAGNNNDHYLPGGKNIWSRAQYLKRRCKAMTKYFVPRSANIVTVEINWWLNDWPYCLWRYAIGISKCQQRGVICFVSIIAEMSKLSTYKEVGVAHGNPIDSSMRQRGNNLWTSEYFPFILDFTTLHWIATFNNTKIM